MAILETRKQKLVKYMNEKLADKYGANKFNVTDTSSGKSGQTYQVNCEENISPDNMEELNNFLKSAHMEFFMEEKQMTTSL